MTKRILFQAALVTGLSVAYFGLSSNDNGKVNVSTSGCGGCHGSTATTTTVLGITGNPTGGYTPGTTYTLTVAIANAAVANTAVGFNLAATKGTLATGGTAGIKLSNSQLTHSAPMTTTMGGKVFTCTWTAPVAGSGTAVLNLAGMTVNGNGTDDAGDKWNLFTLDITEKTAALSVNSNATVQNFEVLHSNNMLKLVAGSAISNVSVIDINGRKVNLAINYNGTTAVANTANLAAGVYMIHAKVNGQFKVVKFQN